MMHQGFKGLTFQPAYCLWLCASVFFIVDSLRSSQAIRKCSSTSGVPKLLGCITWKFMTESIRISMISTKPNKRKGQANLWRDLVTKKKKKNAFNRGHAIFNSWTKIKSYNRHNSRRLSSSRPSLPRTETEIQ